MNRQRRPRLAAVPLLERLRRWTNARPAGVGVVAGAFVLGFVMQACAPGFLHDADPAGEHGAVIATTSADAGANAGEPPAAEPCCSTDVGHTHSPYPHVALAPDAGTRLPSADGAALEPSPPRGGAKRPASPMVNSVDSGVDGEDIYLTTLRLRI